MEGRKEGKKKTKQKQRKVGWGVLNAVLNVFIKDLIKFELATKCCDYIRMFERPVNTAGIPSNLSLPLIPSLPHTSITKINK